MPRIVALVLLLTLFLAARLIYHYQAKPNFKEGQKVEFIHTFLDEPKTHSYYQSFFVEDILILASRFPEFHYGDSVLIKGQITMSKTSGTNTDYLMISNPEITVLLQKTNILLTLSSSIRSRIEKVFNQTLPRDEAGLLLGIVLGEKHGIGKGFYEDLKKTGVLHVVAASGMNVALLSGFIFPFLNIFVKRQFALTLTIAVIGFYALLSGANPPIVRASIMGAVLFASQLFGRQQLSILSLLLAAFIMLFINPKLINDVGFQLSFTSTAGILYIKPIFDSLLKIIPVVSDDLSTTLSAQIASLPIMLFAFSNYSLHSIFVNLLILWTVGFLMLLGLIAAISSLILPFLAIPVLYMAYPFLYYFKQVVVSFSDLLPYINIQFVPVPIILGYYLLLSSILFKVNRK